MITQTAAYVVPFDRLKHAVGSRDLLEAISAASAGLLPEADANRDDEETRTCGEALAVLSASRFAARNAASSNVCAAHASTSGMRARFSSQPPPVGEWGRRYPLRQRYGRPDIPEPGRFH